MLVIGTSGMNYKYFSSKAHDNKIISGEYQNYYEKMYGNR